MTEKNTDRWPAGLLALMSKTVLYLSPDFLPEISITVSGTADARSHAEAPKRGEGVWSVRVGRPLSSL